MISMSDNITLHKISKTFVERSWRSVFMRKATKRTEALTDITLTIKRGEIFGLLGPNGAGKTTLMKILATLIIPDGGGGSILGYDLIRQSEHVRRIIGLVNTSERSFYWRLTGRQNLNFFASLHNLMGKQKQKRVQTLLELVGLDEKADVEFMRYSSGQKQRLALARALLSNSEILLMDEPTQNLDPIASSDFLRMAVNVLQGREGKTIFWCTHNLKEAEEVCSRIAIIHRGTVIESGDLAYMCSLITTESYFEVTIDRCAEATLQAIGITPSRIFHNNGCLDFEVKATGNEVPSIVRKLVENGLNVRSCREKSIDLEDIFEKIINRAQ
jgi:ABC-2 type transport system ATP-binding protein